jgi:hypothetical protein
MNASLNLFDTQPVSTDKTERKSIIDTLTTALKKRESSRIFYERRSISVASLLVQTTRNSSFDNAQQLAKSLLLRLIKRPEYQELIEEHGITDDHWTLVDDTGGVYQAYENQEPIGNSIERINLGAKVNAIEALKADVALLSKAAVLSGGIVSSDERIPLHNWLRFQQLTLPETVDDVKNLIALLSLSLPAPPQHANYWGISADAHEPSLAITEAQQPIVQQEISRVKKHQSRTDALINLLTEAMPKKTTETFLREFPHWSWTLLIETAEVKAFADSCQRALSPQNADKPLSTEERSRLLVAAIMLDFGLGDEQQQNSFRLEHLYHPRHVQSNTYTVRRALTDHLSRTLIVKEPAVPLAMNLILAGLAPEFLVDSPVALQMGSQGWVMLRKSVLIAESIAPGLSRSMSYETLLELGAITPTSSEQQTLHDLITLKCVMEWARVNASDSEAPDEVTVEVFAQQAIAQYKTHIDEIAEALRAITASPVSRRKLAKTELLDNGIKPTKVLYREFGRHGYIGESILDLYLAGTLSTKLYDKKSGNSIYKDDPDLLTLDPVNTLYAEQVKQQHAHYRSGINTIVRLALSRLPEKDRIAIEHGQLALYYVRNSQPIAFSGGISPRRTSNTGQFGIVMLCRFLGEIRCYEIFPLQGVCLENPALAQAYIQGATLDDNELWFSRSPNGDNDNFKALTFTAPITADFWPYFKGIAPETQTKSRYVGVLLDRFAMLDSSHQAVPPSRTPLESFNAERSKNIGELIARHNPPMSYEHFYATGYDKTEIEQKQEDFDNIVETILNVIIPFKGCIEGLSSGDPDRRSGALFSCVMDATAILFVFAGAAGAFAKAAASSAKLLELSKVGTRFLLSVFNPLDGVPQLAYGGVKLIGKGVLKLSQYGHSVTRLGAGQLRQLTSASGSYDLIKALNKLDAATEVRMTLPTVAHGRALFKDDSIETVEHIVSRLSAKNIPLPNGSSPVELQHLFNNAVRETTLQHKQIKDLGELIGQSSADDLITKIIKDKAIRYVDSRFTIGAQDLSDILDAVAQVETKKVSYLKTYQQNVLKQDLGKAPYSDVMPEAAFNTHGYTDNAQRAAAWMVNGATSQANEFDDILAVLREYAGNNKSLTDPAVIREVHRWVTSAAAGYDRLIALDAKYGSSISGFALMEQHLKTLDIAHKHFDKHLLATIVGFQGFGDGNGRAASAMYAISQLRRDRFTPMPKHVFNLLSGMA